MTTPEGFAFDFFRRDREEKKRTRAEEEEEEEEERRVRRGKAPNRIVEDDDDAFDGDALTTTMMAGKLALKSVTSATRMRCAVVSYNDEEKKKVSSSRELYDAESDLERGVYEGGAKVWECAIDLIRYLASDSCRALQTGKRQRIAEIGCGHGLPGIAAWKQQVASRRERDDEDEDVPRIVFADYNCEVLRKVTMPNCRLNGVDVKKCRFVSGDWAGLIKTEEKEGNVEGETCPGVKFLEEQGFDLVLSSDTIYNIDDAETLAEVIFHCLKVNESPKDATDEEIEKGPLALIAAKRYYFGVGGSTAAFMKQCEEIFEGKLRCDVVDKTVDGASNVREIIRIIRRA